MKQAGIFLKISDLQPTGFKVQISVFLSFSFYMCICASPFLLTCILFLFNTDVNWLPGSASPYGYSRQPVLQLLLLIFSLL